MCECVDEWMDGWMNGWVGGWKDILMGGQINQPENLKIKWRIFIKHCLLSELFLFTVNWEISIIHERPSKHLLDSSQTFDTVSRKTLQVTSFSHFRRAPRHVTVASLLLVGDRASIRPIRIIRRSEVGKVIVQTDSSDQLIMG